MRKLYVLGLLFLCGWVGVKAQVNTYVFAQSSGTYSAITGTTIHAANYDEAVASAPIPFIYTFNGTGYTSVSVNTNGYVTFGTTTSTGSDYAPISQNIAYNGAIGGFGRDLISTTAAGIITYASTGTSPNRVFVIQWANAKRYNVGAVTGDVLNFQIRLYETSNKAEIMYGSWTITATTNLRGQVGLRGTSNSDFNNRFIVNNGAWASTSAGTLNSDDVNSKSTVLPVSGLTFTWTPPVAPTTAPACNTLLTPANSATGVSVQPTPLTYSSSPTATSYDIYLGTTATPPLLGNVTTTSITVSGLLSGTTYYWYTAPRNSIGAATGCISNIRSFTTTSGPANDVCLGATTLSMNGTAISGTTVNADQTLLPLACSGSTSTVAYDVWYKFTAINTSQTLTVVGGTGFDAVVQGYSGSCAALVSLGCVDATASGGTESVSLTGLTICSTYFIRVYGYAATGVGTGTFTIKVAGTSSLTALTGATATPNPVCNDGIAGNISLTATGGAGGIIKWYTGSCGGVLVGTGSPLSIAKPTTTTTYFARRETTCGNDVTACVSTIVTVNQLSTNPTSASASPATICNGGSSTLTLTGGGGGTGTVIKWYSGSCGGTLVGTGNNLSVSPLSTTTYYGLYEDPAPCSFNTTCAAVTITVNQKSADPTSATASSNPICNGTSTSLMLNGGGGGDVETIQWFTGSCGGTLIGTGNNLTVSPSVTTTYYGRYTNGAPCNYNSACASVTVVVSPDANAGTLSGPSTICTGGTGTVMTNGDAGGTYTSSNTLNATVDPATGVLTGMLPGSVTITYTVTAGCNPPSSSTINITIIAAGTAGTVSGPTPLCIGQTATYTSNGTAGGTFTSTNTSVATVDPMTGVVTAVGAGTTDITYTITGCAVLATSFQTLTVNANTYQGVSSDWFDNANWSCGVPTQLMDVLIPGGLSAYPIITTGTALSHNITIASVGSVTVNTDGIFGLYGAVTNNGTFDLTDGSLALLGTNVTIAGSSILNGSVKNLIPGNGGTSSITAGTGNMITVTNLVSFASSGNTLNTNGNLTFASTAANTASLSDITAGGTYSGNAVTGNAYVERFIPATRKWRYLSPNTLVGTNSTNTVKETWMENQTNTANRGMWITDPAGTAQGFDAASPGATMKWWNGASYTPITNPTTYDIRQHPAYFTYVRGDRTATGTNQVNTTTRLRTYGELAQGSSSYTVAGSMTGIYKEAGNPYASAIDLTKLTYSTTGPINIYVWDPKLAGAADLGAFQQLNMDPSIGETHFTITPGGGSYGDAGSVMDTLESGLGYFIQSSAAPRTVTYNETAKTLSNHTFSFTPVVLQKVLGTLAIRETNGTLTTVDGLQVKMHGSYNTALDPNDAVKLSNTSENIAVMRENTALALEYRNFALPINDTVFINIANMRFKDYRWSFTLTNLDAPGRTGFLIDQFTGVETQLNLTGGNTYNFTVNATAGSYATGRFMIVFRQAAVLAARKLSIAAQRQADGNINVRWTAENETDVLHYELERSANGTTFNKIGGNTNATNNAGGNAAYTQNDATPVSGDNYYRVKGLSDNGPTQYSSIVKVAAITRAGTIAVRPNPVVNKTVQLYAENMEAGNYQVVVRAANGQTVYSGSISMVAGTNQRSITLNRSAAQGEYSVSVVSAGGVNYAVRVTVLD